jgi:hypothetical protein
MRVGCLTGGLLFHAWIVEIAKGKMHTANVHFQG